MKKIAVADCETDPFKKGRVEIAPFIWGYYDGEIYKEFAETRDFINYVKEENIILYAHNGGKFDWFFVLPYLDEFSEVMIISGRLAKFKIGACEFRDSYSIMPVPLSAYKKDDIDYAIMEKGEREKPKNKKIIKEYLKSDCLYLYDLVNHFVNNYGGNLTLAGSAMKYWCKAFNQKQPRTSRYFYETFKPFYYGGRVECFRAGVFRTDFKVVDINSAYPFAMKNLHPYGKIYEVKTELPKTDEYISRCFIKINCVAKGCFPYRAKEGLIFPRDSIKREYSITGWEYLAALENDAISECEIIEVIQFSESIEFNDYVDHFYDLKEHSEKGTPDYIIAKLFLNSLYGKFASNPDEYKEFMICSPESIICSEVDDYEFSNLLGDWALMQKPLDEAKQNYLNVATAASITGFVRAYLFKALQKCEGLIYCDTDAIAAEKINDIDLHPTRLGAWDVEAVCDWGAVAGKKLYCFHTIEGKIKRAAKGTRLSNIGIIKVAKGVPQIYEPLAPSFSLKRGIVLQNRKVTKNARIQKMDENKKIICELLQKVEMRVKLKMWTGEINLRNKFPRTRK